MFFTGCMTIYRKGLGKQFLLSLSQRSEIFQFCVYQKNCCVEFPWQFRTSHLRFFLNIPCVIPTFYHLSLIIYFYICSTYIKLINSGKVFCTRTYVLSRLFYLTKNVMFIILNMCIWKDFKKYDGSYVPCVEY